MFKDLTYNGDYFYTSIFDGRVMQITYQGKVNRVIKTEAKQLDMIKVGIEFSGLFSNSEIHLIESSDLNSIVEGKVSNAFT